ncbi:TadE family protein [Nocardioides sp.]|uniref:TadE family protein n=1 Tax=Nocardioides sp. TaxID=35761 RepID=UPI0027359379|nr:TadE/TadG family type IV pilus assembly protein [Nocardioides sp.]MDP3889922.1 TadE/TadG family type IV pilus assembly protein [Nocardioides sp.]
MRLLWRREQRGSAVVDFVLLAVILMPIVLGILHLALVLHVRNTLVSAASEGARHAATLDRGPADGRARTAQEIRGALAGRFARNIDARPTSIGGAPGVVVTVRATVPPLGLWGPATPLTATGHAIDEAGQ